MDGQSWHCGACGGENPAGFRFCGHCGTAAVATEERPTERRLVTALFADVSGFTTLADRLDSDELHEVIAPLIRGLAEIAERYGGTVAKYAGDALLVFFGAPVAREDDAHRALEVALQMHAALPALKGRLPPEAADLELHLGVNSGTVVSGLYGGDNRADYSILGDAVNVAQRLESVAPAGATYVGLDTVALTRDRFDFEHVAALTVKNKPEPIPAWRLLGRRESAGDRHGGVVLGRGEELATARDVLRRLRGGQGGVIAVVGEPGVGKTTLAEAIGGEAISSGVRRLSARTLSYGSALAYWPYVDLLRRELPGGRDEPLGQRLAALEPERPSEDREILAAFLDASAASSAVRALSPAAYQRDVHRAVTSWLRDVARRSPVLLTLEDLQWADEASMKLTSEIVGLTAEIPLVVVVTGRDAARDRAAELVERPGADGHLVELRPFDAERVRVLLDHLLDAPAPPALVEVVVDRSAGNPLFVREMLRSLRDQRALLRTTRGWVLAEQWDPTAVPPTIERVLGGRIDALPMRSSAVLRTASVIGREVLVPLLRGMVDDATSIAVALEELVDGGFLDRTDDDDRLRFSHALVQDAAYNRLPRGDRRALHQRAAEVGERLYGTGDDVIDLIARHRYLGEGGRPAIDALLRAARRAERMHALEQAALQLDRAVQLLRRESGAEHELLDVLLELAEIRERRGDWDRAALAYAEVRERREDARAWRGLASTARRRGDYERALGLIEEALSDTRVAGNDRAGLLLERGWTYTSSGRIEEARTALQAGLTSVVDDDAELVGHLLVQLSRAETLAGSFDSAVAHAELARELFEGAGDVGGVGSACRQVGDAHLHAGRVEDAVVAFRQALDHATRSGTVEEIAGGMLNLGMAEFTRGELETAVELDRQAIAEFERIDHGTGRALSYANLAEKLLEAGEAEEALDWCDRSLAHARRIGVLQALADGGRTRARVLAALGRHDEAARQALEAADRFDELGWDDEAASCRQLAAIAVPS